MDNLLHFDIQEVISAFVVLFAVIDIMTTWNRLSASLTKISPLCYNRGEDMFSTLHAHRE